MTEAAVKDSEAMKQIAYLTMIFLPASFVAVRMSSSIDALIPSDCCACDPYQGIFGMNVKEINPGTKDTVPHYIATVVPLTLLGIWVMTAFQSKHFLQGQSVWQRFLWPVVMVKRLFTREPPEPNRQPYGMDF